MQGHTGETSLSLEGRLNTGNGFRGRHLMLTANKSIDIAGITII